MQLAFDPERGSCGPVFGGGIPLSANDIAIRDGRSASEVLTGVSQIWLDMAMKRVKIAELKDQLSRHLREVERGAEVEVTDRNRPIARIVPISEKASSLALIPPKRPFASVRGRRHTPVKWKKTSTELLLEERQQH